MTNSVRLGRRIYGTSGCLVLVMLAVGCSGDSPPTSDPVRPVKSVLITAGDEVTTRIFTGKVDASKRAELAFQVPGLLVSLPIKEGQRVAKGDVIGQLRQDEFQARLKALQGQLDQARASLRALRAGERVEERARLEATVRTAEAKLATARIELDRSERGIRSNVIARADYDISVRDYSVAQQNLESARQMLEKAQVGRTEDIEAQEGAVSSLEGQVVEANLQLQDTTLRAPYDGVIAERFVEANQNVKAKQVIVRFQDVDEIEIAVDVPETVMASNIKAADIVQLVATISGAPGLQFPVQIREVGQVADPVTQTFRVRVALQAQEGIRILPGMTATVTATYRRASILGMRIMAPITAVMKSTAGEQTVWVVGPDSTVAQRSVKLGAVEGDRIEVMDGLRPGDQVVVAGVRFLRDGMKVRDLGDSLGGNRP